MISDFFFRMVAKRTFSAEEAAEFVLADDDEDNASADSLDLSDLTLESSDDSELSNSDFDDETADYTGLVSISGPRQARGRGRNPGRRRASTRSRGRGMSRGGGRIKTRGAQSSSAQSSSAQSSSAPPSFDAGSDSDGDSNPIPKWSAQPPTVKNFAFLETPGLTAEIPVDADPVFFFRCS